MTSSPSPCFRYLALAVFAAGLLPLPGRDARAQVPGREALVTVEGRRLDFAPDGAWRRRARAVAERRRQLVADGRFGVLNADRAAGNALVVTGRFAVPTVLLAFSDTDTTGLAASAVYDSVMYVPSAPGAPYSLRSYYDEVSNGLLTVAGAAYGWVATDSGAAYTIGPCPGSSGLCAAALLRLTGRFREALRSLDSAVDFSRYDSDGADDVPNSGDDDSVVDVIQFVLPTLGGECGGPGFWAHKSTIALNDPFGGPFVTGDSTPAGVPITINSYTLTSGIGGPGCDAPNAVMAIGLAAHELGHGLALPDLYDTGGATQGIGEWGLMGSGMYTTLASPAHFGAWTKQQLGWVTVRELAAAGRYAVGPVVTSDTVLLIRPPVANPRGEYFLLENKQPVLADTANLLTGGRAGPKRGGLLVWHIDSAAVAQRTATNSVNAGLVHGVALLQADGRDQLGLGTGGNRGDAGDPFPGSTGNVRLSVATIPAARLNHDGGFAGIQLDAITTGGSGGAAAFDLALGIPNVVRASDTLAAIRVDGVPYRRYEALLAPTDTLLVAIDSAQTSADGRSRYTFLSWSDGGGREHAVSGLAPGDSLVAVVATTHRVRVVVQGDGTIAMDQPGDPTAGAFLPAGTRVTLRAVAGPGQVLDAWEGPDTSAVGDSLRLDVARPFDLEAWFAGRLALLDTVVPPPIVGSPYSYQLAAAGGRGARVFALTGGLLPPGLGLGRSGRISGLPSDEGVYPVVVELRSGTQAVTGALRVATTAPDLAVPDVLDALLALDDRLSLYDRAYLDLIGNRNYRLDVGDFLAWVHRMEAAAAAGTGARP